VATKAQLFKLLGGGGIAPPTPVPVITAPAGLTGAAYQVGAELTATPPTVTPAEAIISGPTWYYSDGSLVPAASGSTYTPVTGDLGLLIYAQYSVEAYSVAIPAITPTVGPITEAVAPAPAVANQSLVFGRLTYEGYGGTGVVNTSGAISQDCAINSGANANHWNLDAATGVFTPSAAGYAAGLSASYTLGCTFGNAIGTDTATITINTEADTYSVANAAEMQVIQAISVATMSGKTIKMRTGDYRWPTVRSNAWFRNKYYTSQVTVTSHDTTSIDTYGRMLIQRDIGASNNQCYLDSPTNLLFYRCAFYAPWDYATQPTSQASGPALLVTGVANGLDFHECDISANWKELVDTYGFATLYSGGKSSISWTWRGIISNSGGATIGANGWRFTNNTIHGSWRCLNLVGNVTVVGNEIYDFSGDCVNFAGDSSNIVVAWNTGHSPLSTTAEPTHRDAWQFLPGQRVSNGRIYGNRVNASRFDSYATYPDIARDIQGHFMEDVQPYNYVGYWVFGNWGLTQALHGITLYNAEQCVVAGNTYVINTDWSTNVGTFPKIRILRQGTPSVTPFGDLLADNASTANDIQIPGDGTATNNQVLDPLTNYGTYFDGPSFTTPTATLDVQSAFSAKAGSTLATSIPKISAIGTGYFDYENRRWDYPRLNTLTAFAFTDLTGQTTSTLVTSSAVQITGIVRTQTVVGATGGITYVETPSVAGALVGVSGGTSPQFRITSNADGSGVVTDWTATPAIIQSDQYLWVRDTSSASSATTTTVTVQVAATTDSWSVTTS